MNALKAVLMSLESGISMFSSLVYVLKQLSYNFRDKMIECSVTIHHYDQTLLLSTFSVPFIL